MSTQNKVGTKGNQPEKSIDIGLECSMESSVKRDMNRNWCEKKGKLYKFCIIAISFCILAKLYSMYQTPLFSTFFVAVLLGFSLFLPAFYFNIHRWK
mmetsp:Transcript_5183/g.11502  ORF Transcript_5183/g.11502 Transcript_5183/m.11502 type:complete len:97 (-) Transcript_5183:1174-1464(-)